jgi:protein CLEC16A
LYTEALKFFNHDEGMVRIAVRTLTLNVYKVCLGFSLSCVSAISPQFILHVIMFRFRVQVDDPGLRSFILDRSAVPYFSNLVWFMRDRVPAISVYSIWFIFAMK